MHKPVLSGQRGQGASRMWKGPFLPPPLLGEAALYIKAPPQPRGQGGVVFVSPRSFLSFFALETEHFKSIKQCYLKSSNADEVVLSLLGPVRELLAM